MRSVAVALESYAVDYNAYPAVDPASIPDSDNPRFGAEFSRRSLNLLTTPIAYARASDLLDPFADPNSPEPFFRYVNLRASEPWDLVEAVQNTGGNPVGAPLPDDGEEGDAAFERLKKQGYLLMSVGPDGKSYLRSPAGEPENAGAARAYSYLAMPERGEGWDFLYDPTNGTESGGDIVRSAMGVRN